MMLYVVISQDMASLETANSWLFVAEIVGTPCQVIDLQVFAHSVNI